MESDSEDRGGFYGDGDNGKGAAPGPGNRRHAICQPRLSKARLDYSLITIRGYRQLDLPLVRRGKGWWTHDSPLHRTGHSLLYESGLLRLQEIRQGTYYPNHLADGEYGNQRNETQMNLSKHGMKHVPLVLLE